MIEKTLIENDKHLIIVKVIKNGVPKRYEITAEDGYTISNTDSEIISTMLCPVKLSLESILEAITVTEK